MLLLKEKELNVEEEDAYVSTPKRRIMPSRAGYYANVQEANTPVKKEDYTIELVRGGKAVASKTEVSGDLDVNSSNLTEADLRQYEKMSSSLVPSGATMRSLTARQEEEIESADEAVAFRVNKKGLIMLLVYAAIIIGIFAAIIVNAVSLVNLMNTTSALETELSTVDTNLESLGEELRQSSNHDMLYDKAVNQLGMVEGSGANGTLNITADIPEQQILQGSTNLYDWVLDTGLIGIIAGAVVLLGGGFTLFMFIGKKKNRRNNID